MTGKLIIDNKHDAFERYGIFVAEEGYNQMVAFPKLKTVKFNDWPGEDGVEPDLSYTNLDAKEFPLSFNSVDADKTDGFIALLGQGAYHTFYFPVIKLTRKLRLVSAGDYKTNRNLGQFSLTFADDFPLEGCEYTEPMALYPILKTGYELDGRDFSDYGVWIGEGTADEIAKSPEVKKNLTVENSTIDGMFYDSRDVAYKSRDVQLRCCMRAYDFNEFWRNYNALLHDLSTPNMKELYVDLGQKLCGFFYKESSVTRFTHLNGENVWCEFTLTLTIFSCISDLTETVLCTEDGLILVTEPSGYMIDAGTLGQTNGKRDL